MLTKRGVQEIQSQMTNELNTSFRTALMCVLMFLVIAGLIWFGVARVGVPTPVAAALDSLMDAISLEQFMFFALVVTAAFAVRGATGFGSAAIATPVAALVLPVHFVIPVVASLQLLSTAEFSARHWRVVDWREMLRIAPFLVAGALLGLYFFYKLDARTIAQGLGLFIIAYAIYAMATAGRDQGSSRHMPWPIFAALNTVGALVGALFGGASSPFYVVYLKTLGLARDAFRATMSMVILVQVVLRIGGYAGMGLFDATILLSSLIALPFMLLGGRIGDVIADRATPHAFNRIVGVVLLVSGVALVVK